MADKALANLRNMLLLSKDNSAEFIRWRAEHFFAISRFKYIDAQAFESIQASELKLSKNQIEDIDPEAFKNLKDLRILELNSNALQELTGDMFSGLVNLQELYASENYIGLIDKHAFTDLANLNTLNLAINMIQGIHADTFQSLKPYAI